MLKRISSILLFFVSILFGTYFVASYLFSLSRPAIVFRTSTPSTTEVVTHTPDVIPEPIITTSTEPDELVPTSTTEQLPVKIVHDVPFTPQAPLGDWSDSRQQDGCEEASVLMAYRWATGQKLTRQEALEEITNMSNWEETHYGGYRDTSAEDTYTRLLKKFYGYMGGRVEYDITLTDVKRELAAGNILIIPFNGQILANPNFKPPGPERHMLVAIGYDEVNQVIITNDPGTRLGEKFTYSYQNFEDSFRDYETGNHVPITEERTAMIVVEKQM